MKRGLVKLEIGLAKGKKNYDKRDDIVAKKDQRREAERDFKVKESILEYEYSEGIYVKRKG